MKQLGNLAVICAQRPEIIFLLCEGKVSVYPDRDHKQGPMCASWSDDAAISKIIYELNFGKYAVRKGGLT